MHLSRALLVPMRNCYCHLINHLHFCYCLDGVFLPNCIIIFPGPLSEGDEWVALVSSKHLATSQARTSMTIAVHSKGHTHRIGALDFMNP